MSYHEYSNGTHRHYQGIRLGKPGRLSPWETAELRMDGNDSVFWESRAKAAMDAMTLDFQIDDALFNDFNDRYNLVAHKLTWKQIFYVWRVAHLTIRLQPSLSVVDLAREAGLVA